MVDYLEAIEALFAEARGGGFSLSARDVEVALGWERQGIPLDVVLRAMRDFNERARKAPPRSLGAYSRAVEKAFALARSLRVGAHDVNWAEAGADGAHS
ncbi:MAG: hypothetical protein HYY84_10925 [Deltaproteobacteria bacterium]|nr:hypothetical protein [Deltaproteobacteria bacterium]